MSRVAATAPHKQEEQNKENNPVDVQGNTQVPRKRQHQSVNTKVPYSFAAEKKVYEKKRDELLKEYPEKFALIKAQAIIGIFEDEYSAFTYGCEKYGSTPFLIQPITEKDEIVGFLSR